MDRHQQLKILYDEVQRWYLEGIDEATAYDRLRMDQCFSIINQRSDIQELYNMFQKKKQLEAKMERLARLMDQMDKERELLSAEHYMMKFERQNAKKHLISSDMKSKFSDSFLKFWQGRYALGYVNASDMEIHTFEIFDMFHQQLRQVTAPSHGHFVEIHALADPFLLFVETSPNHATYYVSLVKFEPDFDSLQVLQTIERPNRVEIHVDSFDSKKFLIQNYARGNGGNENYIMQLRKLINGQIELGNEIEYQNGGQLLSYFDGNLYSFVQRRNERLFGKEPNRRMRRMLLGFRLKEANMQIFDLDQGKNTVVTMNAFPANVEETLHSPSGHYRGYAWVRNCCFISVKFKESENFGIIFASAETRNWTVLDLAFKFEIRHLQFNNADLMVHASEEEEDDEEEDGDDNQITVKDQVFKFQMRKPDRLRCMGWQEHIQFIKESTGAENPHEAALPYLPYNSDVQPFCRIK